MILRKDLLIGLNEEQKRAVVSNSNRILCIAAAGSGKTTVLTKRIAYTFLNRISTKNIVALTFTRAAGEEIKKRLYKIDKRGAEVFCDTFHKFCIGIIEKYGTFVGLKSNFTIISEEEKEKILLELTEKYKIKKVSIKNYNKAIKAWHENNIEDIKSNEKELIMAYHDYMKENNCCDIDLTQNIASRLLDIDEVKKYYHTKCKYILIDEYQDNNDIQEKIIKKINPYNLFVVGDPHQSIYSFRGANINNILTFKDRYDDVEIVKLNTNYRSTNQIIDLSNKLIKSNLIEMKGIKEGKEVEFINTKNGLEEIDFIFKKINEENMDINDTAIISRTNKELDIIQKFLVNKNVNVKRSKNISFNDNSLSIIRSMANIENDNLLFSVLKQSAYFDLSVLTSMKIKSLEENIPLYKVLESESISLYNDIRYLREIRDTEKFVKIALRIFNVRDKFLENFIEEWVEEKIHLREKFNIYELIKEISLGIKKTDENGIRLVTVHGSKGLEWQNVFVIGLNEGNFPNRGDIEEEIRLAYVAFTRSMERLVLISHDEWEFGKKTIMCKKSRFLDELENII